MQKVTQTENRSAALLEWLEKGLATPADGDTADPLANDVRRLAYALSRKLHDGEASLGDVQGAVRQLAARAYVDRARRFAENHSEGAALADDGFAKVLDGLPTGFEAFNKALTDTQAGVVFTAHPTFSHSQSFRAAKAAFIEKPDDKAADALISAYLEFSNEEHKAPTLTEEHEQVGKALVHARAAMRDFGRAALIEARKRFPDQWQAIRPMPLSLASWVGYDLDGRTDIRWFETIRIRLEEKATQLGNYIEQLKKCAVDDVANDIEVLSAQLLDAQNASTAHAALFAKNLDEPEALVAAANAITGDTGHKMISLKPVIAALTDLAGKTSNSEAQIDLLLLASEMEAYGLGVARIHLRINAAQVRSALRSELSLSSDQAFFDRTVFDLAADKFKETEKERVNFASLFAEKMTARRQFMLCAQLLKHVDADTPIRFLIAECEAPATVMGAVYLARKFGVEKSVDISPLFETPDGIEKGGRLLERLLAEESYRRYVTNRGVLAIQLGFSDSGRFMGQVPSNMAIERLHIQLAREMGRRGLTNVKAICFNTHGESMGRGCFPGSLKERFDFNMTPWARARYGKENVGLIAESSFQGGDGFMHFETPSIARSTIAGMLGWGLNHPKKDKTDRFYEDINFSWDLFRSIKAWQEDLFSDPSYRSILTSIGPNFLPLTGSRKVKRDTGSSAGDVAKSLRAIPHNAILQQLAAPANVFGGLGAGGAREPERFIQLIENSGRVAGLIKIAKHARERTSLSVLRAYASLFDPGFWFVRARFTQDGNAAAAFTRLGEELADGRLSHAVEFFANNVSKDRRLLDTFLREEEWTAAPFDQSLYALHVLRIAVCMHVFYATAHLPGFSSRHDVSLPALMTLVLGFQFAEAAEKIKEIFPEAGSAPEAFANIEEAADNIDAVRGYPEIHQTIVEPLFEADELVKEITKAIVHFYDAFG